VVIALEHQPRRRS